MDPIIKWPGGKSREIGALSGAFPEYTRLVEPFAGGAAAYLASTAQAGWLNDASTDLVGLYEAVAAGRPTLTAAVEAFGRAWLALGAAADEASADVVAAWSSGDLAAAAERILGQASATGEGPFLAALSHERLARALAAKGQRIAKLARLAPFSEADQLAQVGTAARGALYTAWRDVMVGANPDEAAVRFWAVREQAYGGLMRRNRAGRENVPYGGASYDRKAIVAKAGRLVAPEVTARFAAARRTSLDFRDFFAAYGAGAPGDFVFLDPPYETTFSTYDGRAFGAAEQEALGEALDALRVPFLVVIAGTELTKARYFRLAERHGWAVSAYDFAYQVNIRNRNSRVIEHLVVTSPGLLAA